MIILTITALYLFYILTKSVLLILNINTIKTKQDQPAVLMDQEQYSEAAEYALKTHKLSLIDIALECGLFLFWIFSGLNYLEQLITLENIYVKSIVFMGIMIFSGTVISLPLDYYKKFSIDQRFGFNRSTQKLYFIDLIKGLLISGVLIALIVLGITFFILNFTLWWLFGFILIFAIQIVVMGLYTTLIVPLFNKLVPLEDSELKSSITTLLQKCGFKASGLFTIDASKRDSRLNAYFSGLGHSKKIVLYDTLIKTISPEQLLAVLAHELGHFKHKDILKSLGISAGLLFSIFYLFAHLPTELFIELNLPTDNAPYLILALLMLLISPITFFLMPLLNRLSQKNEYRADQFGAEHTSATDLKEALTELGKANKHFPHTHPLYVFFHYSHPPMINRLEALERD